MEKSWNFILYFSWEPCVQVITENLCFAFLYVLSIFIDTDTRTQMSLSMTIGPLLQGKHYFVILISNLFQAGYPLQNIQHRRYTAILAQ